MQESRCDPRCCWPLRQPRQQQSSRCRGRRWPPPSSELCRSSCGGGSSKGPQVAIRAAPSRPGRQAAEMRRGRPMKSQARVTRSRVEPRSGGRVARSLRRRAVPLMPSLAAPPRTPPSRARGPRTGASPLSRSRCGFHVLLRRDERRPAAQYGDLHDYITCYYRSISTRYPRWILDAPLQLSHHPPPAGMLPAPHHGLGSQRCPGCARAQPCCTCRARAAAWHESWPAKRASAAQQQHPAVLELASLPDADVGQGVRSQKPVRL